MESDSLYIGYITTDSKEKSKEIATKLLEARLIACCNIIPTVESIYEWKGQICHNTESLMIIKTVGQCIDKVKDVVVELHSYEVPEIIFTKVEDGHKEYLDWAKGLCKPNK